MKTALELMEDHAQALTEQRDALAVRVAQLEAALAEAQEWNWFEPEEIPGEVHQQMLDAMTPQETGAKP